MSVRSKSGGADTSGNYHYQVTKISTGEVTKDSYGDTVIATDKWSMTGVDLPHFYKRKRSGELLPHTNFTHFIQKGKCTSGEWNWTWADEDKQGKYLSGPRALYGLAPTRQELDDLLADSNISGNRMVQAAAASIYGSGHDSLTFLSELHKTAKLFTRSKKELVKMLKPRKWASNYLEARYGWRILWYDMQEIAKVVKKIQKGSKRDMFSSRVGQTESGSSFATRADTEFGTMDFDINTVDSWTISTRGFVTARINPATFRFNPVVTGWELITFSFVIDWFISVGLWLEAMSFLVSSDEYTASSGVFLTHQRAITLSNVVAVPPYSAVSANYYASCTSFLKIRTPQSVSLHPYPAFKLDLPKILDLYAIAASLSSGDLNKLVRRIKL